jgi:hypothetical protein
MGISPWKTQLIPDEMVHPNFFAEIRAFANLSQMKWYTLTGDEMVHPFYNKDIYKKICS